MLNIRAVRPCSADQLRANVRYAIGLGHKGMSEQPERSGVLHIYASGPSLKDEPFKWPCIALNGAIREFTARGQAPTWWCASDPQPLVADFLTGAVKPTHGYLIASRCDRAVFDALHGQDLRLFHVADEGADELDDALLIPDAPSVTINALFLAVMMGFRAVEVHGWDGCYVDDVSHADGRDDGKTRREVECNGNRFMTNTSWIVECEDAKQVIGWLCGVQGMDIHVAGNGLMATALNSLVAELKQIRKVRAA